MNKFFILEGGMYGGIIIAWDDGTGEPGLYVGQAISENEVQEYIKGKNLPEDREEWETVTADLVLQKADYVRGSHRAFTFESMNEARKALKLIKESLKHDRELPEWAKTAFANGFKAPKNWKP